MATSRSHFIERHGLWTADQARQAEEVIARIEKDGIRNIRIGWGDQHGIVRGKTVTAGEFKSSLRSGKDFQLVTAIFDTTNHPIVPPFSAENALKIPELIGLPDGVLVPDPSTFRVLPWAKDTGWCLSDAYFGNGAPCPLSTRQILRNQLKKLASEGLAMTVGLEFEFYASSAFSIRSSRRTESGYPPEPPEVGIISHGYQYLTENRGDEIADVLSFLQENLEKLGLPSGDAGGRVGPRTVRDNVWPDAGAGSSGLRTAVPARRSSSSAAATAFTPASWPCRRSRTSFRAVGTCISRSRPRTAAMLSSRHPEAGHYRRRGMNYARRPARPRGRDVHPHDADDQRLQAPAA